MPVSIIDQQWKSLATMDATDARKLWYDVEVCCEVVVLSCVVVQWLVRP